MTFSQEIMVAKLHGPGQSHLAMKNMKLDEIGMFDYNVTIEFGVDKPNW